MNQVELMRQEIIDAVKEMDAKQLEAVMTSIVEPTLKHKLDKLFDERKIYIGKANAVSEILAAIKKVRCSNADKIAFVDGLLDGSLYDTKKMASNKRVHNVKAFIKSSNPVINDNTFFEWFIKWAPKIAGQGVGSGEAFMLLTDKDGDNSMKGDAYIGQGYNIEIKSQKGSVGEKDHFDDGFRYFKEYMSNAGLGVSEVELKSKWGLLSGPRDELSKGLNRVSFFLKEAGKSDAEIGAMWDECAKKMMGGKTHGFAKCIKNGVTDPNMFKKLWMAAAVDFYKDTQGWDYLYLFNTSLPSIMGISLTSGSDYLKISNGIRLDNSLDWKGAGNFGGSASPRIYLENEVKLPVITDKNEQATITQYHAVKKLIQTALSYAKQKSEKNYNAYRKTVEDFKFNPALDHAHYGDRSTNQKTRNVQRLMSQLNTKEKLINWYDGLR